jgi:hypothetical protein
VAALLSAVLCVQPRSAAVDGSVVVASRAAALPPGMTNECRQKRTALKGLAAWIVQELSYGRAGCASTELLRAWLEALCIMLHSCLKCTQSSSLPSYVCTAAVTGGIRQPSEEKELPALHKRLHGLV